MDFTYILTIFKNTITRKVYKLWKILFWDNNFQTNQKIEEIAILLNK